MAYTITLSNGTVLTTINNNVVDTTTSLSLIGRNFVGYGGDIAEDFVHLLENFANITAPLNPLSGQLWFNSTISRLQIWWGSAWHDIGESSGGITIQDGLTLYDPSAPSDTGAGPGSRYYRIRVRDDGHWVLESLHDDQTVNTVILDTDNHGAIKLVATPNLGDSSTLIATTAFVKGQAYAPLASPPLTGTPTSTTPSTGDNSTKIATTAFVKAQNYQAALGFTPVQQGGGASQSTNKIYIGWDGTGLRLQVDVTDEGKFVLLHDYTNAFTNTGNAASSWWRKAPDGWIEQGGFIPVAGDTLNAFVSFVIPFQTVCVSVGATIGSDIIAAGTTGTIGIAPYGLISGNPAHNLIGFAISNSDSAAALGFISQGVFWFAKGF